MTANTDTNARARLLAAATELFAEKGFTGASVREICTRAGTSSRMIHHYFGSKEALYDAVMESFSNDWLSVPIRLLANPARSAEDLATRFEMFVSETLHAIMANAQLFDLMIRERTVPASFNDYYAALSTFLRGARDAGLLRDQIDPDMLTGLVLDRVGNQVIFADAIRDLTGANVFTDPDYKARWIASNVDLILWGVISRT